MSGVPKINDTFTWKSQCMQCCNFAKQSCTVDYCIHSKIINPLGRFIIVKVEIEDN